MKPTLFALAARVALWRAWRDVRLPKSWERELSGEFSKPYMRKLWSFLQFEKNVWEKDVYPEDEAIFAALKATPLDAVKVVIIGQDPYHGGEAHGLSFSVQPGKPLQPSLRNIFDALHTDMAHDDVPAAWKGSVPDGKGCLTPWVSQGVLLLNATLTVAAGCARSHRCRGWEEFTNRVVKVVSRKRKHVVFLLWGEDAQQKGEVIENKDCHKILEAPHPQARRKGEKERFRDCRHFSEANQYLVSNCIERINWFNVC